jgi:SAM-dependent methyltransferase
MGQINLLDKYPKSKRPIEERGKRKLAGEGWIEPKEKDNESILMDQMLLNRARQFGREYFDGDRLYGYGGYYYDSKYWSMTAKRIVEYYSLPAKSKILDVGCAKGFLLYDIKRQYPDMEIAGIDISEYAITKSKPEIRKFLTEGNAARLPYQNKIFDLVISINTVDHLDIEDCKKALLEIERVKNKHSFITVNAWRNELEKERLEKWNITAKTAMHVDDWKRVFEIVGYTGDYYWFFPE